MIDLSRKAPRRARKEVFNMKSPMKSLLNIGSRVCLLASLAFLSGISYAAGRQQSEQPKDRSLVQVESKYVCMVNNQRFDKEQIAIKVKDRTYYGCCEMCKEKLRNNAKSRVAIDPVSGKQVDKAIAVIGASPDGKVYYFESVDNLKQFKVE
jgi:YHS domain-containing protein